MDCGGSWSLVPWKISARPWKVVTRERNFSNNCLQKPPRPLSRIIYRSFLSANRTGRRNLLICHSHTLGQVTAQLQWEPLRRLWNRTTPGAWALALAAKLKGALIKMAGLALHLPGELVHGPVISRIMRLK